jgi:outer membrane protein OmpA-like peptidoglycan-associated protein
MSAAPAVVPDKVSEARASLQAAEESFHATGASVQTRALASEAEQQADRAREFCSLAFTTGGGAAGAGGKMITQTVTMEERTVISLPSEVLFAFDKATLLPSAEKQLLEAAEALRVAKGDTQGIKVVVVGHTDSVGSEEYNQKLSEERAAAVRDFLVAHGQDPNLITVRAMGKEQPNTSNDTAEGRANNRRVEILIQTPRTASLPRRKS